MAKNEPGLTEPTVEDSELFTPSLQTFTSQETLGTPAKPWRLQSQMWIAFLGGSLAITTIAFLNAKRLHLAPKLRRQILLAGAAGFLLTAGIAFVLRQSAAPEQWQPGDSGFRLISRVIALLVYLFSHRLQRPADRAYQFRGGEHASLWKPGLLAIFVLGTLQNVVVYLVS